MHILFVTLEEINDINKRSLYADILRAFKTNGHQITVISANERRNWSREKKLCYGSEDDAVNYILAKTGNITKNNNFILKGISVVLVGYQYINAYRKSRIHEKYDLIICTTPSITFEPMVRFAKRSGDTKVVLLLKDMWPYDLVFDNILSTKGIKGLVYKYFDKMARKLYAIADVIGCMSPKNIDFLINATGDSSLMEKTRLIPNSIDPLPEKYINNKADVRKKYGIPQDKTVFLYGGNLGTAQGMEFAVKAIEEASMKEDAFFLIVGSGTHAELVCQSFEHNNNVMYLNALPKDDFELLCYACDVGLIFLNWNCHTPNIPSRILPYMQASLPIICCTDDTTDIGSIAEDNGFGVWCPSDSVVKFCKVVNDFCNDGVRVTMGRNSRQYLIHEYSSERTYHLIMSYSSTNAC